MCKCSSNAVLLQQVAVFRRLLIEIFRRMITGKISWPDTTPPTVTVLEPTFLPTRAASQSLRATWLGHACYYVEFPGGLRVLFDPVFEDRCSPFSFMGPKRYTKVPCHIKDLPAVDVVVISHSHYGIYYFLSYRKCNTK